MKLNMKTTYRNVRESDIGGIAELVSETFDGPFNALQAMQKSASYKNFLDQFQARYDNFVKSGKKKHAMLVAVDESTQDLKGFLELGTLPSPIPVDVSWKGITMQITTDIPYLGNVAVSSACRRQGIASKLIRIAEAYAEKWGDKHICAAVDCDNVNAISMYEKMNFEVVRDERDLINRNTNNAPRLFVLKKLKSSENKAS